MATSFLRSYFAGVLAILLTPACALEAAPEPPSFPHAYGSTAFTDLVKESTRVTGLASPEEFRSWMDDVFLRAALHQLFAPSPSTWTEVVERNRMELAGLSGDEARSQRELALAGWLHGVVQKALPNYSLERGFELANTARRQERQCLMQSLLISSLLQAMGVDAGLAMVNKNPKGEFSNNAHVVVLVKLSNGNDALVDGSYPTPLVAHGGLMVMMPHGSFRYVRPVYTKDYRQIVSYLTLPSMRAAPTDTVRPMGIGFVRSQIDYYRGERTPGGVLMRRPTVAGLDRSVQFFQSSLKNSPNNPLPAFMLGMAYEKLGRSEDARRQYRSSQELYEMAGWAPAALTRAMTRTEARSPSSR